MGPTRDGRTKPEIVAPADHIATARASNAPSRNSDPDNYHQVYRGTSVAAPHVVGVIALMLQMNHYLSPGEIRSILTQDARQDAFTGRIDERVGSPLWGWGKVNALNSTRDAPNLYAFTIEINSIGSDLPTNLTLDGRNIGPVFLNETRTITLEFQRGGNQNHVIAVSSVIQAQNGTRYLTNQSSWTFSSGGKRTVHYDVQFYLEVTSPYGSATGTGWYAANSTATASVTPTSIQGERFVGWTGSEISSSPTVTIKMDSSKNLTAEWFGGFVAWYVIYVVGAATMIALAVALLVVYRTRSRRRKAALRMGPGLH